jgi:hypothetical protein
MKGKDGKTEPGFRSRRHVDELMADARLAMNSNRASDYDGKFQRDVVPF